MYTYRGGNPSDLMFVTQVVRLANAEWNHSGGRGARYVVNANDRTLEGEYLVVDAMVPDGAMYVSELISELPEETRKGLLL